MKTSPHGSPRSRRFGSSLAAALAFASLSFGIACDVEEADVPIEDRVELFSAEELEGTQVLPATRENLEAFGVSEDDVQAVQAGTNELVAEDDVTSIKGCSTTCVNDCAFCCINIQQCHFVCGHPNCG